MNKCKECENRKFKDLMQEIAHNSIDVTHKDYNKRHCDIESMVNTIWVINFIIANFKLK